jgi:hypothetical protein
MTGLPLPLRDDHVDVGAVGQQDVDNAAERILGVALPRVHRGAAVHEGCPQRRVEHTASDVSRSMSTVNLG